MPVAGSRERIYHRLSSPAEGRLRACMHWTQDLLWCGGCLIRFGAGTRCLHFPCVIAFLVCGCKADHFLQLGFLFKPVRSSVYVCDVFCIPQATLLEVLDKIVSHRIHRVYVVDETEKPCGVVTCTDVLKLVVQHAHLNSRPNSRAQSQFGEDQQQDQQRPISADDVEMETAK